MKETVFATYERESTLWPRANYFYVAQDWTKMECVVFDYTDEIDNIREFGVRYWRDGVDVTEEEIERVYGRPYMVRLTNNRGTNSKGFCFATKDEANEFWKSVMNHKVLKGWHRV